MMPADDFEGRARHVADVRQGLELAGEATALLLRAATRFHPDEQRDYLHRLTREGRLIVEYEFGPDGNLMPVLMLYERRRFGRRFLFRVADPLAKTP